MSMKNIKNTIIDNQLISVGDEISYVSRDMRDYAVYTGVVQSISENESNEVFLTINLEKSIYNKGGIKVVDSDLIMMVTKFDNNKAV